jgi:NAD(P)-dependent dehydrogenase (short-subunit alcohol dehydrogenase family)
MLTLVLGVGPGLGMALARRFGREGDVALLVRDDESGARFVGELGEQGTRATAYVADLGDEAALAATVGQVVAEVGLPDVVIYNASLGVDVGPEAVTRDQLTAALRLGTFAAVTTYQVVVPAMRERGSGTFLVTGSGVSVNPWPGTIALSVDKAALRAFALGAARDLKDSGVHAGTVTIMGVLGKPGFDVDHIAETFWAFHAQAPGSFEAEVRHTG